MKVLPTINQLQQALDYHMQRHNVLASNLAHVDTPNYRPVDLKRVPSFKEAMHATMETTQEGHVGTVGPKEQVGTVMEDREAARGADGNGVSLEKESVKIAANNVRYDTIANLLSSELSMMAWAANDGR